VSAEFETSLVINYNIKAITNGNQRLWQIAFDLFADLRSKICVSLSYMEGVRNYGKNYAQVLHRNKVFQSTTWALLLIPNNEIKQNCIQIFPCRVWVLANWMMIISTWSHCKMLLMNGMLYSPFTLVRISPSFGEMQGKWVRNGWMLAMWNNYMIVYALTDP